MYTQMVSRSLAYHCSRYQVDSNIAIVIPGDGIAHKVGVTAVSLVKKAVSH